LGRERSDRSPKGGGIPSRREGVSSKAFYYQVPLAESAFDATSCRFRLSCAIRSIFHAPSVQSADPLPYVRPILCHTFLVRPVPDRLGEYPPVGTFPRLASPANWPFLEAPFAAPRRPVQRAQAPVDGPLAFEPPEAPHGPARRLHGHPAPGRGIGRRGERERQGHDSVHVISIPAPPPGRSPGSAEVIASAIQKNRAPSQRPRGTEPSAPHGLTGDPHIPFKKISAPLAPTRPGRYKPYSAGLATGASPEAASRAAVHRGPCRGCTCRV
jgi:hypothetical protein